MTEQQLTELKSKLREQVTEDPKAALKALKSRLSDDSRHFNTVLQLQLQLNQVIESERFQLTGRENIEIGYGQVTKGFLEILQELKEKDFLIDRIEDI